ncbi:MAG: hypothetical protein BJ554DRAFT_519 [Olpidium bornovanus]|uniref:Uncharacterized protein n=1 Tax=Olpidium bornovanus TaxID=278681 RepID=A0A8H7ZTU7_9FUNG|nr:MAG: hypothetical protein BJ554DRAFT_519 [Olpidium bornovanus]
MPPKTTKTTAHDAARRKGRNYRTKQPAAGWGEGGVSAERPPASPEEDGEQEPPARGQPPRQGEADSPPSAANAAARKGAEATGEKDDKVSETGLWPPVSKRLSENLEDLFEFRRLRKRKHGVDSEKLQKGESKKKRSKAGAVSEGSAPAGAGGAEQAAGA